MKIRLTPLNIVASLLLVGCAYLVIFQDREGWRLLGAFSFLGMAFISFIADMIFRWRLTKLKRIWMVEALFVIFVILMMIFIRLF